jgi:hypothetical protein
VSASCRLIHASQGADAAPGAVTPGFRNAPFYACLLLLPAGGGFHLMRPAVSVSRLAQRQRYLPGTDSVPACQSRSPASRARGNVPKNDSSATQSQTRASAAPGQ